MTTNLPYISAIVPVYNTAAYLPECIESLLDQDVLLEILLINDGSTDNSGDIAEHYKKKDTNIRVIHQQNRGLPAARNRGLTHARGKYVLFIDSDNWVGKDSYFVEAHLRDRFSKCVQLQQDWKGTITWHNGVYLDFFVYDYDPEHDWITNSYERILNESKPHLLLPEIEYLDTAIFEGGEYPIPVGYDAYLKRCYGNYMELPPESEQVLMPRVEVFKPCNHPASLDWKDYY